MKYMILIGFLLIGCAQQPSREQVAVWSYFLEQCKNEGISSSVEAMQGCIILKLQQARIGSNTGDVLQAMGAALNPQVYQSFAAPPGSQQCHTTPDYAGGYRTVCQ